MVVAWPLGLLLGSGVIRPDLRHDSTAPASIGIPPELGWPAAVLGVLALIAFLLSLIGRWTTLLVRVCIVFAALAAILTVVFVGLPALIDVLRGSPISGIPPFLASGSFLVGAGVAVWRIIQKP